MTERVKELVVVSGKGGTGKTTVAADFALLAKDAVVADCDVDAANLSLVLRGVVEESREFQSGAKAYIDPARCVACGVCEEKCRFGAIRSFRVDPVLCEGCGLCSRLCPNQAIEMRQQVSGYWYVSRTVRGPLVHGRLEPGGDNSGQLVTAVRERARDLCLSEGRSLIITDGPPGIGCPVIASLSGADLALIVAEPSLSGLHDLERVVEVCRRLDVPTAMCVNKYDIDEPLAQRVRSAVDGICLVDGLVPYDEMVPRAMAGGMPVAALGGPAAQAIKELWARILEVLD